MKKREKNVKKRGITRKIANVKKLQFQKKLKIFGTKESESRRQVIL